MGGLGLSTCSVSIFGGRRGLDGAHDPPATLPPALGRGTQPSPHPSHLLSADLSEQAHPVGDPKIQRCENCPSVTSHLRVPRLGDDNSNWGDSLDCYRPKTLF